MQKKCPKCGSLDVEIHDEEMGFLKCRKCHYNELEDDVVPGERTSQREKGRYSPYKTGGKGRSRKK